MQVSTTQRVVVIDATRVDNGNAASGTISKLHGRTGLQVFVNFTRVAAGAEDLNITVEISDDGGSTWFNLPHVDRNTSPDIRHTDGNWVKAVASTSQTYALDYIGPFAATDIKITAELDSGGGSTDVATITAIAQAIG